jgi:hypothetical protein
VHKRPNRTTGPAARPVERGQLINRPVAIHGTRPHPVDHEHGLGPWLLCRAPHGYYGMRRVKGLKVTLVHACVRRYSAHPIC